MSLNFNREELKRLLKTHIITLALVIISGLFSAGVTYARLQDQITVNADKIEQIANITVSDKVEVLKAVEDDRNERMSQLARIETKIDEINIYLRDQNNIYRGMAQKYNKAVDTYNNAIPTKPPIPRASVAPKDKPATPPVVIKKQ
jgi:hypothetical protein